MYKFIIFTGIVSHCWAVTVHEGSEAESAGDFDDKSDFSGGFGGGHSFGGGGGFGGGHSFGGGGGFGGGGHSFGGGGGGFGSHVTLGEISVGHFGHNLPAITLDEDAGESFGGQHGFAGNEIGGWSSDSDSGFHDGHSISSVKHIGVPVVKKVPVHVPHPVIQTVPQPYPVVDIVSKPVPYEVVKQVFTKVEKKVPTPVHKIIPVPVHKHVPYHVYKHVPVPVVKRIPIKIPIYKTIVHKVKGHHH